MGTSLNWERLNMRKKILKQGSVDGRFASEKKQAEQIMKQAKARALTDKDRRSLHYIFTRERI